MRGTARTPWGSPPRRERACAVAGEWLTWPRVGVARAVDEAEDRVRGERDREGLHRVVVGEAARVPAHGRVVLHDEHRGALDVLVDLAHEVGEHLGEVRALLDDGDGRLEAGVVGGRRGRGLLREHLRDGGADRLLVDLLVVAGHRLAQLVERANEEPWCPWIARWISTTQFAICWLMRAEVRAFRSSSRLMFPSADAPKMTQYPDLRPRALSGTRSGVSTNTVSPAIPTPLPPPRAGGLSSQGHATRRAERHAPPPPPRLPTPAGSLRSGRVVAWRVVVRGLRRGDPGPEHRVGERRANPRFAAAARLALVRGAPSPSPVAARAPAAILRDVPREGAAAAGLPRLPRVGVRGEGRGDGGGGPGAPAREAPRGRRHRPRDRGLDRALRGGAPGLRRGRVRRAASLSPPRPPAGRRELTTRCSAS